MNFYKNLLTLMLINYQNWKENNSIQSRTELVSHDLREVCCKIQTFSCQPSSSNKSVIFLQSWLTKCINTLKPFWPILGQRKTSLVIFLWKRRTRSVVFLANIISNGLYQAFRNNIVAKKHNWTRSSFS